MTPYVAPLADIGFVLDRMIGATTIESLSGDGVVTVDTMLGLIEEFGRFCAEQLAPLNRVGDVNPCAFDPGDGTVRTPPGWQDAYAKFIDAGWGSVGFDPSYGGGGFPLLLTTALNEVLTSANMAFSLAPILTQGAVELLQAHATLDVKEMFLRPMVSAAWTGTMNLTEPDAGSDVGALTTRARPTEDGRWRVTGTKVFISYGDHDLTDNVVHTVLARTPGAPSGTKGISCFVVPKVLPDGTPNAVRCVGIEHKMGLHGSPTCTMEYADAVGWLVGEEPNHGMAQMFTMMNHVRLAVGVSGLALGERALQAARRYAQQRVQGRVAGATPGAVLPIAEHPDVRRMLLHLRSHVEAMRALVYTNAASLDVARSASDPERRARAQERADLLTPITKGWCTDLGSVLTRLCTQIHGGMGYIAEMGVEQFERDVRIASIYEGTNGIQAIDLVCRKLPMRGGAAVLDLIEEMDSTASEAGGSIGRELHDAVAALQNSTEWLLTKGGDDTRAALAGATPYLQMFGIVVGGWFMTRQAMLADTDDRRRQATSRYYCEQVLPTAAGLVSAVTGGAEVLFATESLGL